MVTHGNTYSLIVDVLILGDGLGRFEDLVGNILRSETMVRYVVLDTKVVVQFTRVTRGSKEDAAISPVLPDHVGCSGS